MVPEREPQDTDILLEKLSSKQTLPTKHTLHGADSDVESDMDGIRQRYRSPPEALGLLPDKELADDSTSDLFPDRLCTFAELPEWMQDNEYILAFYRPPTFSYRRCFASLCYLHNETGNIYTHAIGALMYLILGGVTGHMLYQQDTTSWSDSIVFYLSIGGAVICLGLSASFHMLNCHSEKVCATWNRCDYVGIVTMIVGALYPAIYYGFFCKALARNIYMIMVTLLGAATIYICVSKHFASPEYRWFRTITFLSLGGSGFLPIIHLLISFGWQYTVNAVSFPWLVVMGVLYLTGAIIYGARVPERWWPGRFDLFLHSHQIFHVIVLAASMSHYYGMVRAFHWHHTANPFCAITNFMP